MTLYEITGDILKLQEMAENGEFGENPEADECFNDTLESVMADFEKKADDYGHVIKNLEATYNAVKAERERLGARESSLKKSIERIKERLMFCMEQAGKEDLNGKVFRFKVQKGPDKLPDSLPFASVPAEFVKIPDPQIDRKGLLKAVKEGKVKDITLIKGKSSLRIS